MDIPKEIKAIVEGTPRGCYQRALLNGQARWSGGDLRGKAGQYRGRYSASRAALLRRINDRLPEGWKAAYRLVKRRGVLVVVHEDTDGRSAMVW